MYGMVNKAVEDMVCLHHGEAVWEQIKSEAGVDVDVFMSNESYSDDITYLLVAAASKVLKMPVEQILIGFGEHWILHTAQEGYGGLLQASGKNLPDFLRNLPNFHSRVAMIFPKLQPPPVRMCQHHGWLIEAALLFSPRGIGALRRRADAGLGQDVQDPGHGSTRGGQDTGRRP